MASGRAWEQAEFAPGMVYPSGHTMMGAGRYCGRASGARSGWFESSVAHEPIPTLNLSA